ncbi:T9SS type A sorting domain-containing protein [Tenacibaculum sp. SDUM215027]|uniref:T9SS type A sorting domain-containing protein n=1 Tax=Tenacibaculum sp. SDUM215027 TaxID=3422596 RepID=UPI003D3175BF
MEFGSSTLVLADDANPSVDQSANSLLNSFDMSCTPGASNSENIILAFATSGNGVGTDAIGGVTDAVLSWAGNGSASIISGTLSTDSGGEIGITSMQFAYQQALVASDLGFTFTGKKNGTTVGTLILVAPTHNSAISINLASPTTGSFSDIDELIITPDTPLFGGFSIDDMVVTSAVSNTAPIIGGTTAGQSVNDNSTISPFSSITTTDADGDNLSATITLDNNAKGVLSGTGLSGSGPYTIASTTPGDLQSKLSALSFNPTDNRTATSETTTFTVVINDGTVDDTDNTTTVISSAVAPTVTSVNVPTNATYITGQNLDFTVNFDENVTVNTTGGIPQIAITIGATTRQATYISGSGTNVLLFRHTVLTGDLDTDGIAVGSLAANGSTLKDAGGKDANLTLNSVGATAAVLVDAVPPTVTNVNVPTNATYISGQNLDFTVNFNENVTVNTTGGTPQIAVTIGATTRQAVYQNGSGTSALVFRYTVQSGDSDTDGIAVGTLAANGGTLKDAASNDAVLTLNSVGSTTGVLVDAVAPTITNVSVPANGTYSAGQNLDFTVNFNENITVNTTGGTPQIAITIGATTRQATYLSGSGTSALLFRYTIQAGDSDTDGITVGTLATNGGTLKDAVNNDADLILNSVGATTAVLVDAVAPTVTSVNVPANATYITGQNLDFTVNFNENISVNTAGGTPQIAIIIGATTRQAAYQSGSGTSALFFRYTVQSGDLDTDGITVGTLAANGGTLKDSASNDANLTLNSVGVTTGVLVGIQTYTWTGTTNNDWDTASNWDSNSLPSTNADIIIPSGITNYPTITSPVTVNSITINSGASLIATSSVTASVTYKRNIADTNWHLVAPPLSGETQEDIISNHTFASGSGSNIGIGSYTNNGASPWTYATPISTGSTIPGYGFSIKLANPGDVSITGNLVTTNYGVPISTGTRTNYNLLGNPYTNYINSATLAGSNPVINNATFWLWDGTKYITHNNVNPIEIAPSQGFFVEANSNSNVIFFTSNQSHQGSDTFMKQEPKTNFELQVSNGEKSYSTSVFYIESKSTGFDYGYDSKMFSGVNHDFSVFTQLITENEGKNLAIQTLPTDNTLAIPVGVTAKTGSKLTFSIKNLQLPDGLNIYLEDKNTGEFTNLSEENYTATLNKDSNGIGQFYLYKDSKKPTSIIEPSLDNISIYNSSDNEITIVGLQTEANVAVYSILGKEIINRNIISNGISKISIPNVATGVYIVKLNSNLGKVSKKIILK